jgi:hypothetical protein
MATRKHHSDGGDVQLKKALQDLMESVFFVYIVWRWGFRGVE